MSKSITQDMAYRQSLMKYAEKYGVSRASRKYNKSRSYIYFWRARWDGSVESLACQSRRPHSHPNQHTEAELKLIRDMRRRNPQLGLVELWHRLKQRGYTRRPESLFRVMRKLGMFPQEKKKKAYTPKPYQQMTRPGERIQVDVKVVPRRCIADPELRLFQYTAIDEFSRLRFLAAYPEQSTYSPVILMEVDFSPQHLAVHNAVQGDHLTAGPPLDQEVPGGPPLQGAQNPVHGPVKGGAVQGLDQIAAGLYVEGVKDQLLQDCHKDQQAVIPPPAEQPGRLHAVGRVHLDVQKNHIKAAGPLQQGVSA